MIIERYYNPYDHSKFLDFKLFIETDTVILPIGRNTYE
jgi:hypothetical protein